MQEVKNPAKQTKYIFITGGVLSSLGKGISSASLGLLLKHRGYSVTIIKLDPYINVDPGTMSPFQHGEVFVTNDGAETDLDLGHYERYLNQSLNKQNNTTAGQVYLEVITKERNGHYLGKTVQVIPHITDEIKRRVRVFEGQFDFVLVEIGGTVGDIESLPFLEASRQIYLELGHSNVINILLTYVPYIESAGELKTKPTQHSVKKLMEHGIIPDILLCRTQQKIPKFERAKIALFCNVSEDAVIEAIDVETTTYEVPIHYAKHNLDKIVLKKLNMPENIPDNETWNKFVKRIKVPKYEITIGLVGKYTKSKDSYKSIIEAFIHAGSINDCRVNIEMVNSEEINDDSVKAAIGHLDGILVGPGFDKRGVEGKITAIKYVRENQIPFFGICLGLQCAVIEFARNICGLKNANSTEFDKTTDENVIDLMEDQRNIKAKGATMRLGAYPCNVKPDTQTYKAYKEINISERHRHRYEVNNDFKEILEKNGMIMSGLSPDGALVEIIELPNHPWFIGSQFHPELQSRAVDGHPLFISFIKNSLKIKKIKEAID
ncbi:MAG: CTP synthase [Candidatus Kapabacteria bacterium]|nr:CTP synthase [Candidatus Kapabacteria bacterium]